MTPGAVRSGAKLLGHVPSEGRDEILDLEFRGKAGGLAVPAATQRAGDARHVDAAIGGAQACLSLALPIVAKQPAHKHGHRRALDGTKVVHDPLRVGLEGPGLLEIPTRQRGERYGAVVVAGNALERAREQQQPLGWKILEEPPVHLVGRDPRLDQLSGHAVGRGRGVLVHEPPGVGDEPDVEGVGNRRRELRTQLPGYPEHDLGGARGAHGHEVDRPEPGVVMVMGDVEDVSALPAQEIDRHTVDVAAVEEDDNAVADVLGGGAENPFELHRAVFVGQRKLVGGHIHRRVLAHLLKDQMHAEQRAEGVAVGGLVGRQEQLVGSAELLHHLIHLRPLRDGVALEDAHRSSPSSSSSEMRKPWSTESSCTNSSVGVLFIRTSAPITDCRYPAEDWRPSRVSALSSSVPSTLTYTRPWRRSALVSTAVTVTNPMRGSLRPAAMRAQRTSRSASLTRRMRPPLILDLLQLGGADHRALPADPVPETRIHKTLQGIGGL